MPKPFIDALIESDGAKLKAIFETTPPDSPWHKTFRAIVTAREAKRDNRRAGEAWLQIREALSSPPQDAELLAVLLSYAMVIALHVNRIGEAARSCRLLKQLDGRLLRPEVRAQALYAESNLNYALGQIAKAQALLTQALALEIPAGGNTWYRLKAARAFQACVNYDFATVEQDLADMDPYLTLRSLTAISFETLKAGLACMRGKPEEVLALLGPLPEDPLKLNEYHLSLYLELLLRTERVKEAEEILRRTLDNRPDLLPKGAVETWRSYAAMVQKDLPAARGHAKLAIASSRATHPTRLRNACAQLVTAELALRNARGARLILELLDREHSDPRLVAQWTRLYLLEGAVDQAASGFKRLLEMGGPELVDSLFAYAYEVSAQQLSRLWVLASQAPAVPAAPPTQVQESARGLKPPLFLVGGSPAMRKVAAQIRRFAPLPQPVLIVGETGAGKEAVARRLHGQSNRSTQPFLVLACEALSDTLLEAELFGYEQGAFAGALARHDGALVAAGQGTVLLDEIGALSPRLQAALLGVLEKQQVLPLGARRPRAVQARVVAASRHSLAELAEGNVLRPDLFARLSQLHVRVPPLRERPEDIAGLAKLFLRGAYPSDEVALSEELLQALQAHPWPGNVRELKGEIERMLLLASESRVLGADLLRLSLGGMVSSARPMPPQVCKVVVYFRENLSRPIALEEAAQAVPVSPSHLIALFHEAGLESPMACLREMRLLQAQALLGRRELRIKEVAAAVGYASMSSFWRAYVRFFKHPPSQELQASSRATARGMGRGKSRSA